MEPASEPRPPVSVPFARPDIVESDADAVRDVIMGGWLTSGEQCRRFEAAFANAVGARHAVALNSGTAAMHLSLEALGITGGDLVVTTPYTFAATAEVVHHLGAVPVFVDIDPLTCNISTDALEATLKGLEAGDPAFLPPALRATVTPRLPRAVVPVHIGGVPCDLDRIYALAARAGVAVVEDAAHAFPAAQRSRPVGAAVDATVPSTVCFSFYATKTITTGEGGMLVTDVAAVAERARTMSLHGLSRAAWTRRNAGDSWRYEIVAPGFKYNLTDMAAALGLAQLARADAMRHRRAAIATRYNDAFSGHAALDIPHVPADMTSAWHLYMVRIRPETTTVDRDRVIAMLTEHGIGTSVHFIPLHLHSHYVETYGYRPYDFPVATHEYEREISLPIFSGMSDAEVDAVVAAVLSVMAEVAR